jgi:hypothetical protein
MIVWRGYGILIILIAGAAFMVGALLIQLTGLKPPFAGAILTAMGGLAGVGIFLFAQRIESRPGRILVDKATGREVELKHDAGSLFFVPTRYWAYIVPAMFAIVWIATAIDPKP